jgi:hypothetical protein
MLLSLDDLELKGEEKEKADQRHKKWRIEQAEQSLGIKQVEIAEQSLGIKRDEIEQAELARHNRELSESLNRQSQQLHFYSEMRIAEQVEAMRRFKTKPSIEQTKPTKKPINEQRDDDFKQWENEENPDLESMTKDQIQQELIKRNSHLWCSGFDGWWKEKNKTNWWKENSIIIGCKAGRPKKQ